MEAGSLREAGEWGREEGHPRGEGVEEIRKNVAKSRNILQQEQHTQTGTTKDGDGNR